MPSEPSAAPVAVHALTCSCSPANAMVQAHSPRPCNCGFADGREPWTATCGNCGGALVDADGEGWEHAGEPRCDYASPIAGTIARSAEETTP